MFQSYDQNTNINMQMLLRGEGYLPFIHAHPALPNLGMHIALSTRPGLSSLLFQGGRSHLVEIAFVADDHSTLTLLKFLLDAEAADIGANGPDSKKIALSEAPLMSLILVWIVVTLVV